MRKVMFALAIAAGAFLLAPQSASAQCTYRMNDVGRPHGYLSARAMALPWVMPVHIPLVQLHRSRATATLAGVTPLAKRSAKRLGSGAVSQMFRPATENGPGSTPTRNWLARASINRARSNAA